MSIVGKQFLVIIITFLFLVIQLAIKNGYFKPRDISLMKINGLAESNIGHPQQQLYTHVHKQTNDYNQPKELNEMELKNKTSSRSFELPGDESEQHRLTLRKSEYDDATKSRMDSTRAQYIKVCKSTLGYSRLSSTVKYESYAFKRLQWCSVPKSGTTFLTRELRPTLRRTGENNDTPKRFLVVREPYARLVSAFFSKIVGHPSWWFAFGTKIIARFRPNPTEDSLRCGHDVTFREFINFFIFSTETLQMRNVHFLPIHMVCDMCDDPPDFIAKIETLASDMKFVLNSVNVSGNTGKPFIEVQHLAKLFMSFKSKFERCAPMCSLLNRFWWGQQATGLISNDIPLPVKNLACDQVTGDQLADLAWNAHLASKNRIGDKKDHKLKTAMQLWSEVPLEDKKKVRDIFTLDCRLFGYDCSPDFVFPKSTIWTNILETHQ